MKIEATEAFEVLFDCLSSNDAETKEQLERYVIHRKMYGRQAAARIYPHCHNIIIKDPMLQQCWNTLLKTIDKL